MKAISQEEIRSIQIAILNSVDAFCRKNNLKYSLAYGTLIGAVRHKGFIPWDDDIDIIMPRPDYDRFVAKYKDSVYDVLSYRRDVCCHMAFAEVYDNRTILIHGRHSFGVFIDVFPVDGLPEKSQLNQYIDIFLKKQNAVIRKRKPYANSSDKLKEYFYFCIKNILFPRRRLTYISEFESFYKTNNILNSPNAGCLANYGVNKQKEIMPAYIFKEYIELPFEGKYYMCLKYYDEFLQRIYGDYMKLPPVDQQVGHHDFKTYWKE